MKDTQWPRYQVFVEEQPGGAVRDAGSVHAPDVEMALFNARDVFARRPGVFSLWVIPAASIYSKTRQELEMEGIQFSTLPEREAASQIEKFLVCCKAKSVGAQIYLGSVEASAPKEAMVCAVQTYSKDFPPEKPPFAWWVFQERSVTRTDPQDAQSFFAPALHKPFRLSTDFHVVTAMREVKGKKVSQ